MAPATTAAPDQALWVGYGGATLHDGTELIPGVTVCNVPRDEAEQSDHWQPLGTKPASKRAAKRKRQTKASESAGTSQDAGAPSKPQDTGDTPTTQSTE